MLITGGAGFIGVNAAERFLGKGWKVVIFDNFSRKGTELHREYLTQKFANHVTIIQGDIRTDQAVLDRLCNECDVVLHLAAQVAVTTSVVNPREDFEINAFGTFNVLEAVRKSERKPLVLYASTNKVYGGLENVPVEEQEKRYVFAGGLKGVSEEQLLDFHSPYGCSKGAADQYVRDYSRLYDIPTIVLRQSCIYGQHQMGIEDQGWVAWFLLAALFGKPVTIYGNGKQVRDLLHVDDLIDCYELCIEKTGAVSGHVFNIGGGHENTLSLIEFLELLRGDLGLPLTSSSRAVRPGDQPIFISDNSAFMKATGWQPKVNVRSGIRQLKQWLEEHRGELQRFY